MSADVEVVEIHSWFYFFVTLLSQLLASLSGTTSLSRWRLLMLDTHHEHCILNHD